MAKNIPQDVQVRYDKLKHSINRYRHLFHVENKEEISPEALDSLKAELVSLEEKYPSLITPDSPSQRVGGAALGGAAGAARPGGTRRRRGRRPGRRRPVSSEPARERPAAPPGRGRAQSAGARPLAGGHRVFADGLAGGRIDGAIVR